MKWAGLAFFLGVVVLVVALATATTFFVAFVGFVFMLGAALWFERSFASSAGRGCSSCRSPSDLEGCVSISAPPASA